MCVRVFRARNSVRTQPDEASMSISMLNRHINSLRKRIRRFEECFEQERNYKVQRISNLLRLMSFIYLLYLFFQIK